MMLELINTFEYKVFVLLEFNLALHLGYIHLIGRPLTKSEVQSMTALISGGLDGRSAQALVGRAPVVAPQQDNLFREDAEDSRQELPARNGMILISEDRSKLVFHFHILQHNAKAERTSPASGAQDPIQADCWASLVANVVRFQPSDDR